VLKKGEHPFIKHESVIAYGYAAIKWEENIDNAILNGVATKREPVSPQLLKRVQAGLIDSDFTPNEVRHFYKSINA
jgi:hypothetical protein